MTPRVEATQKRNRRRVGRDVDRRRQSGARARRRRTLKPNNGRPSVGGKTPGVKTPAARVGGDATPRGQGRRKLKTDLSMTAGRGKKRARVNEMDDGDERSRTRWNQSSGGWSDGRGDGDGTDGRAGCCLKIGYEVPSPTPIEKMSPSVGECDGEISFVHAFGRVLTRRRRKSRHGPTAFAMIGAPSQARAVEAAVDGHDLLVVH